MNYDASRTVSALCTQGFDTVPMSSMSGQLQEACLGFEKLLQSPESRAMFTIPDADCLRDELGEPYELGLLEVKQGQVKKGSALGFFDKAAGRVKEDANKHRFHFSPRLTKLLCEEAKSKHRDFLAALLFLNADALWLTRNIVYEFDRLNASGGGDPSAPMLSDRLQYATAVTRVIRYGPQRGTRPDAQVHRDRGFLTVHHYSSRAGLSLFDHERRAHQTDETDMNSALVFTGEKFWGITRGKFGTAVPHGVYDRRRVARRADKKPRYVLVTFVHLPLTEEDKHWIEAHISDIKIDQSQYRLR